jgi:hypothetical protein
VHQRLLDEGRAPQPTRTTLEESTAMTASVIETDDELRPIIGLRSPPPMVASSSAIWTSGDAR